MNKAVKETRVIIPEKTGINKCKFCIVDKLKLKNITCFCFLLPQM
jgi:hypothetical protein